MTDKPWLRTRLKNLVDPVQTGVWGAEPTGDDNDILCVRVADFDRQRLGLKSVETVRSVPEGDRVSRLLQAGDILLEKSGGTEANPVGFTVMFDGGYPAVSSNFIGRVRMHDGQHPRFWLYSLAASYLTRRTQKCVRQTTGIQNLDQGAFFNEVFAVPPLGEQRAIADHLDRETARIDTLIEEQQRLIEMLRERRQAVIDAPFLTLGEAGVQLRRYIKFLTSGSRGWGDYYANQGERFLRIGNLPRANLQIRGDIQFVDLPADVTEGSRTVLQEGDLLFSITAYLGSVAVVGGDWVGAYVSQHVALCRLECDRLDARFIGWFMLTTTGQNQLNEGAAGGAKMQLALDDIRGLQVPTAPIEQQHRIAAQLDRQTAKIDELVAESERFIELARERRAALISAAVTGQIDVREMA